MKNKEEKTKIARMLATAKEETQQKSDEWDDRELDDLDLDMIAGGMGNEAPPYS